MTISPALGRRHKLPYVHSTHGRSPLRSLISLHHFVRTFCTFITSFRRSRRLSFSRLSDIQFPLSRRSTTTVSCAPLQRSFGMVVHAKHAARSVLFCRVSRGVAIGE